jgi:hypothetical protein
MSDWRKAKVHERVAAVFPNARCWQKDVGDGHLTERTYERQDMESPFRVHVSISHRVFDELTLAVVPGRYPTWDEQKEAVWRFAPGKPMASYLPPEGDPYVNLHETTFHWWEIAPSSLERIE